MERCPYRKFCVQYGENEDCVVDSRYCLFYTITERSKNRDALRPETPDSGLETISEETIFIN